MKEGSFCYKECQNKHACFTLYVQKCIFYIFYKHLCVHTLCNKEFHKSIVNTLSDYADKAYGTFPIKGEFSMNIII